MDANYILSSTFMLIILVILWMRAYPMIKERPSRFSCLTLIITTAVYVLIDAAFIATSLWADGPVLLFKISCLAFYIIYTIMPFAWHMFVRNFVGSSYPPIVKKLEFIPLGILFVLVLITPATGAVWTIDANKVYDRGILYYLYTVLNLFYYVEPILDLIVILVRRKQKEEPYFLQSLAISSIPLLGTVVNNFVIPKGTVFPFMPFCSVLVAVLAFFFMSSKESQRLQNQHNEDLRAALSAAQEASRVKTVFLSNMSHDIRTPMNAIINLTHLAQEEKDEKKVHEYLDKLSVSGEFLLGLINDILDMSRIESGEITLRQERLPAKEFLATIDTIVAPLMDAKHIHFHQEVQGVEGFDLCVDRLRFNQIFLNLLSNAEKFTPEGGDVWFASSYERIDDARVKVIGTVKDNGIGMSEDFMKHLFEPFAQEHSALGDKRQGTGLGLSIADRLAKAMGGKIEVESKLGQGSTFTVTLVVGFAKAEENGSQSNAQPETIPLNGMNVLLVEDNELNTYVAKTVLEKEGCAVKTVKNGKEAVDAFLLSPISSFDAILMDVRMPVMDGLEATKAIRSAEREDAKSTPIIAMTADAFDEERKRTLEAGMDYHLSKPVDTKELCRLLGECYARKAERNV